ncbi:MAG: ATP-binding protein [Calditrichaeota bacterium]|nr:MAG: ATP-binding protein [Calditrichota bacterium]
MGNLAKKQRKIIEEIYRRYTDPEDADLMQMIEGMLHLLGERLNRSDIHFVAELVQNAEDAGVEWRRPKVQLRFSIERARIIVQNDGRPFDEDDVKAICRAAASSKRHTENQIGFMGIGFKSVFKITEAPEVHSNGFHFRIRRYIYPEWIDEPSPLPNSNMESAFVFPLKKGVNVDDLAQEFDRLDPTMLLFLKKLKNIEIDNRVTDKIQVIELSSVGSDLVLLESFQGKQYWRLAIFPIIESVRKVCSEERERYDGQELKIACAVDKNGRFQRVNDARFFAFLPTDQETGLGFHLQADFVPTASRENIDESNKCNQLLLRLVGRNLVKQVCIWRDEGGHDTDLYSLLPLENEAKGIARLVAREIKEHATGKRLIFTRSGEWVSPSSALVPTGSNHHIIVELLTKDDLTHYYKRPVDFIHPQIRGRAIKVVEALGVKPFGLADLCEMLQDKIWLSQKPINWFLDLFIFLHRVQDDIEKNNLLETLRALPVVPVEGRKQSAANILEPACYVFLPLNDEAEDSYRLFQERLNLIDRKLTNTISTRKDSKEIHKSLKWLGVQPLNPNQLIPDVILPIFEGGEWQGLDDELHFAYLDFTRRHWQNYEKTAETAEAKKVVRERVGQALQFKIKSHSEPGYRQASSLLLSDVYKRDDALTNILQNVPELNFIDDCYALHEKEARSQKKFNGLSWRSFLYKLGMLQRSDIKRIFTLLDNHDWLTQQPLNWLSELFIFLYDLHKEIEKAQFVDQLKALPIIPLQDGSRVSVQSSDDTQRIFLPLTDDFQDSYAMFQGHLSLVAKSLLDIANEQDDGEKIYRFLEWLGVKPFEPHSIIHNVILPIFEGNQWEELEAGLHFSYLDFTRQHWQAYREQARSSGEEEEAIERAGQALRFQCQSDSDKYLCAGELFLPNIYHPDDDLESKLANIPGVEFVSDVYNAKEQQARQAGRFVGPTWQEFLRALGVISRFDVVHIIDDFILPQFSNYPRRTSGREEQHFLLVDFIRRYIEDYDDPSWLADKLWLASAGKDGLSKFRQPNKLYISQTYDSSSNVANAFREMLTDHFVSDLYWEYSIRGKAKKEHREIQKSWRDFFRKIGLLQYIPLQKRHVDRNCVWQYPESSTWREYSTRDETIEDYWNELFKQFLEKTDLKFQESCHFLRMLDEFWEDAYALATKAEYKWFYYYQRSKKIPSELAHTLKQYPWLPTKAKTMVKIGDPLFLPEFEKLVGNPEQVCAVAVHTRSLQNFLGIRSEFTVEDALNELDEERQKEKPDEDHLRALYEWLQDNLNKEHSFYSPETERVRKEFNSNEYIYLPEVQKWIKANSGFWEVSPSEIVNRHRPALNRMYDGLRVFFIEKMRVRERAEVGDYLDILANEIAPGPILEQEFQEIFRLFQEMENDLQSDKKKTEEAIRAYRDKPVWLCEDGLLRPASQVYVNDRPQMYKLLEAEIHCIWLPPHTPPASLEKLIQAFELNRLSEAKPKISDDSLEIIDGPSEKEKWTIYLQRMVPAIGRYIYTHHPADFHHSLEAGIFTRLHHLTPVIVQGMIPVTYQLPHGEKTDDTQEIYVDLDQERLYLTPGLSVDNPMVSQELCRAIGANREVQNFVDSLLPRLERDGLERYVAEKNLSSLPEEIQKRIEQWQPESETDLDKGGTTPELQQTEASKAHEPDEKAFMPPQISEFDGLASEEDEEKLEQRETDESTTELLDFEGQPSHPTESTFEPELNREDTPEINAFGHHKPQKPSDGEAVLHEEEDSAPTPLSSKANEEPIPPFTGEAYPRVPSIPTDWDRLREKYGEAVDNIETLEWTVEDDWNNVKSESKTRPVTSVRFILSFMNVTRGFLPLNADTRTMLESIGNPSRLICQLDDETEFDLYVNYDKRVIYNHARLQNFFAAHNIPAGGIVYLEKIHERTVRLYYKSGSSTVREIRCAELQPDGSVKYFYIESAEYPCEVAEFVFRAEKRLEDPAALFAESIGKKSVFETMIDVFDKFGPELTLKQIFNTVSTIRMVAFSTIRSELQKHPCFVNLGNGKWRFESECGFKKQKPQSKPGISQSAARKEEFQKLKYTSIPSAQSAQPGIFHQQVEERLTELRNILNQSQDKSLLVKNLTDYLSDFLNWLRDQGTKSSG